MIFGSVGLAGTAEKGCTPHRFSAVTAVSHRKCYAIRMMGFPPLTLAWDLVNSAKSIEAPPNARVAAANTLLDRAYGRAHTFSTTDPTTFKRAIDMTDDELAAIVSGAKLTIVKSDT